MAAEIDLVVAALTGGGVNALLTPLDAATDVWRDRMKSRILRTARRAERKRELRSDTPVADPVSERVAYAAFQNAAHTDDEVLQEYLAGVIAGGSETDDKAQFLALISRLSPQQLRLHYDLYRGVIDCMSVLARQGPDHWGAGNEVEEVATKGTYATLLQADLWRDREHFFGVQRGLRHLQREQLIVFHDLDMAASGAVATFGLAPYGLDLFVAALGWRSGSVWDLLQAVRHAGFWPERQVNPLDLDPPLPAAPTIPYHVFHSDQGGDPFNNHPRFDRHTWSRSLLEIRSPKYSRGSQ